MDRSGNPVAEIAQALDDIRLTNRFLGGRRVLLAGLGPFLGEGIRGRPLEILDVGTGGADLPIEIARHAGARGRDVLLTIVDHDPAVVAVAAAAVAGHPEIRLVRADAADLPFGDGSFDIVSASMVLHHFDHAGIVRLLSSFRRLARRAVVVNDLRRHLLPWGFIHVAARVARRSPMYVHDAPLSVLRGFSEEELIAAGREAGVPDPRIERRWPFRLLLTLPGNDNGCVDGETG